jgi:hypothetical protein
MPKKLANRGWQGDGSKSPQCLLDENRNPPPFDPSHPQNHEKQAVFQMYPFRDGAGAWVRNSVTDVSGLGANGKT